MKKEYIIQNLKCGGCAKTITNALKIIEGVNKVSVNTEFSMVSVNLVSQSTSQTVIDKLTNLGYPLLDADNSLGHKAKSYLSCMVGKVNKP